MTDQEKLIIDLRNEIDRLREGYMKIILSSDIEMSDGDLARDISKKMLRSIVE